MEGRGNRKVNPVGMNEQKQRALDEIKRLRLEGGKRSEQYQIDEKSGVFEEDPEKISRRQQDRDFIVDDEGIGYLNEEDEVYSDEEEGGKYRKKRVKDEGQTTFHDLIFAAPKAPKNPIAPTGSELSKMKKKTEEQKSKDILESLMNEYDNPEPMESRVVFNIQQQYEQQYGEAMDPMDIGEPKEKPQTTPAKEKIILMPYDNLNAEVPAGKRTITEFQTDKAPIEPLPPKVEPMIEEQPPEKPEEETQKETNWEHIKAKNFAENVQANAVDTESILKQAQQEALKGESDGSMWFYWIDAFEEPNMNEVYFTGKVKHGEKFFSCCLVLRGLERCYYAVPKCLAEDKRPTEENIGAMFSELEALRTKKFPQIKKWRCKPVKRKYHFELPILHGENTYLKMKYPATYPPLPYNLSGSNFCCLIGTTMGLLENVIIKRKIWGPCWLHLKNWSQPKNPVSWCRYEIVVDNPKNLFAEPETNYKEPPPLSVLSVSIKHHKSTRGENNIAMISCVMNDNVNIEKPVPAENLNYTHFSLICPRQNTPLPFDIAKQAQAAKVTVMLLPSEKVLLSTFLQKLHQHDPDVIVGHDLYGHTLDLILSRIQTHKDPSLSKIGRMKRLRLPKVFSTYQCRVASSGRLLCDTYVSAKDMIPKESNYDLVTIAKKQLNETHVEFDPTMLNSFFSSSLKLVKLIEHNEKEAYLSLKLMHKLAVLPLTKQLANIAGHLWIRALQNARAERNEMLLMHKFHDKKYIILKD